MSGYCITLNFSEKNLFAYYTIMWQQPFNVYQAKCLKWVREEIEKLDGGARAQVMAILDGTGFDKLVGDINHQMQG